MSSPDLVELALSDLDESASSAVADVFDRWGWGGAVLEDIVDAHGDVRSTIKTYVAAAEDERVIKIDIDLALINRARAVDGQPAIPMPRLRRLSETDWAEAWKAHYHVLHIGRRLVIKPTWESYSPGPDDVVIELDPGLAFGSGLHASTRLCLEMLETQLRPGQRVLDVGTGSGILAIAAAGLGARTVLGLDNDPEAVRVARENVALNRLADVITVQAGTLTHDGVVTSPAQHLIGHGLAAELPPQLGQRPEDDLADQWDTVLANILAETIIDMSPALARSLAPDGQLIASGIIQDRADAVVACLRECGLHSIEHRRDGEWVALLARR